jgi:ribonuclease-3
MKDTSDDLLARCQKAIGYRFKHPELLASALTHASVATSRLASNERMEFLGDAVLGLVVCQYLYEHYPEYLEGELTKIKSLVVSRRTCAEVSEKLGLPQFLALGNGIAVRSKLPSSVSAAVFESLIAALMLDGGIAKTSAFILRHMVPAIEAAVASQHQFNYKSQQHAQKEHGSTPSYEVLDEKGPDHSKCFEIAVRLGGQRFPSAWGTSKKEAEQKAAYNALLKLKLVREDPAMDAIEPRGEG